MNRGSLSPLIPTGTRNSYSCPGAHTARTRESMSSFSSETSGCTRAARLPGRARFDDAITTPAGIDNRDLRDGIRSRSAGFQQSTEPGVVIHAREPRVPLRHVNIFEPQQDELCNLAGGEFAQLAVLPSHARTRVSVWSRAPVAMRIVTIAAVGRMSHVRNVHRGLRMDHSPTDADCSFNFLYRVFGSMPRISAARARLLFVKANVIRIISISASSSVAPAVSVTEGVGAKHVATADVGPRYRGRGLEANGPAGSEVRPK